MTHLPRSSSQPLEFPDEQQPGSRRATHLLAEQDLQQARHDLSVQKSQAERVQIKDTLTQLGTLIDIALNRKERDLLSLEEKSQTYAEQLLATQADRDSIAAKFRKARQQLAQQQKDLSTLKDTNTDVDRANEMLQEDNSRLNSQIEMMQEQHRRVLEQMKRELDDTCHDARTQREIVNRMTCEAEEMRMVHHNALTQVTRELEMERQSSAARSRELEMERQSSAARKCEAENQRAATEAIHAEALSRAQSDGEAHAIAVQQNVNRTIQDLTGEIENLRLQLAAAQSRVAHQSSSPNHYLSPNQLPSQQPHLIHPQQQQHVPSAQSQRPHQAQPVPAHHQAGRPSLDPAESLKHSVDFYSQPPAASGYHYPGGLDAHRQQHHPVQQHNVIQLHPTSAVAYGWP